MIKSQRQTSLLNMIGQKGKLKQTIMKQAQKYWIIIMKDLTLSRPNTIRRTKLEKAKSNLNMKNMDLKHFFKSKNIKRYQTTITSLQLKLLLQIIADLKSEAPRNFATFGLIPKEAATASANTNTRKKVHLK